MQDAPLHRLEAVVCIRERPGNDDFSKPIKQKEVSRLARDFPLIA
jgi:hypothetical protein